MFFSHDSQSLQELRKLIEIQNHRSLVMWAFECAKLPLALFEAKYSDEPRLRRCLELCEAWARRR